MQEGWSALEVLKYAGSPDFVHPWIAPEHEPIHNGELPWDPRVLMQVSEFWDYYRGNGEVLRVFWEPPEIVDDRPASLGDKIRRLETVQMTEGDWDARLGHLVQRWRGSSAARIVSISTEG